MQTTKFSHNRGRLTATCKKKFIQRLLLGHYTLTSMETCGMNSHDVTRRVLHKLGGPEYYILQYPSLFPSSVRTA
jgi:hypothetical protein